MPIDTDSPESEGWWLQRLSRKLTDKQKRLKLLDDYYRGDPPLPQVADGVKSAYQAFQKKARTNYARLIVEAVRQRMSVTAIVTGAESSDENGDLEARRIWVDNGLHVESAEVHRSMLRMGDGYVIVGMDEATKRPVITSEDPRQVVTEHDPARQRNVRAALKMFHDPITKRDLAYLFLPGRLRVAQRPVTRRPGAPINMSFSPRAWEWDEDLSGTWDPKILPVTRFRNENGTGEFEPHLDHLDRINHMLLQRMVIATIQAFRQRALKGDLPDTDEDGKEIDYDSLFVADPGALWQLPAGVELWESGQVDLGPILTSVRDDVKDLAAVTFTPLNIFDPAAANNTAEGAALTREGLVFKAEDRITRSKDGWAQVMSHAFAFLGDTQRADLAQLEVKFASPDRASLAERYDAAVKAKASGVPYQTIWSDVLQFTPDKVRQMTSERAAQMLLDDAFAANVAQGQPL